MEPAAMVTHEQIWAAIDRLAESRGLTPSGLARRAGLDATSFNPSKRQNMAGRRHWPSMETIAKILDLANMSLADFAALADASPDKATALNGFRRIPLIGLVQAGENGFFDDGGFPVGGGWEEAVFPNLDDPNAYALEISGDSMLPAYRSGDIIIVSPNASTHQGDRVVVRTVEGEVMAKLLARKSTTTIELHSFNPAFPARTLARDRVVWIARIAWASQ